MNERRKLGKNAKTTVGNGHTPNVT